MSTQDPHNSEQLGQPPLEHQQQGHQSAGQAYTGGYSQQGGQGGPGYQQQGQPYGGHQGGPGYQQQGQPYGGHQGGLAYQQQQSYGHPQQGHSYHNAPVRAGSQPGVPVGFIDAIKRFYAKYAQFSGRASRSEYWWVALYLGAVYIVLSLMSSVGTDAFGNPTGSGVLAAVLLVLFSLGNLVPSIAIGVRRLHDVNMSGWFMLLGLIPYVGGLVLLVFTVLPPKPEGARFDR